MPFSQPVSSRSTFSPRAVLASLIAGSLVVVGALGGCDVGSTDPAQEAEETSLSVYLTDAPGDVAAVWVDIAEIYFQGGPGGRFSVLTEPTGLIELTSLQDRALEVVAALDADPGMYRQLRFILSSAVLEATNGEVYAYGSAEHPDGLATTGELMCPGCSNSGLKVQLSGDAMEVDDGANSLVLDFDVAQSFGKPAGQSGKWVMKPVIHGVKTEDGDDPELPGAGSSISGTVALAVDGSGAPIVIPECPVGSARSIEDFVVNATALALLDADGQAIVRAAEVGDGGSFSIDFVGPDQYTMGFLTPVELGSMRLTFDASISPVEVTVVEGEDVEGVEYVIAEATCEENPAGS